MLFITVFLFGPASAQETLRLGVHPYLPAEEIMNRFAPLAEYLSGKTGKRVEVIVGSDYDDQIDRLGKGDLDIAYMGPASYVELVDKYGMKQSLARLEVEGKPSFKGVIIVRNDCECESLAYLKGKRFAFGDPDSTMSHLVPRYMLLKAGIGVEDLGGYEFLNSHHNVVLGVLVGDFEAGAVKEEVFYEYEDRGLKALAWTPELSEHLFVVRDKLPAETVDVLRKALLGVTSEPGGDKIINSIKQGTTAFVPVTDSDYDNLRQILRVLKESGVEQ